MIRFFDMCASSFSFTAHFFEVTKMPYLQKNWRPRFGFLHGVSPEKCHLGQGLSFDHKFHKFSPIRITLAMRGGHLLMHKIICRPVCFFFCDLLVCSQNVEQVWRFEIFLAHVLLFARLCDKDLLLLMMIMIHDYSWWLMIFHDEYDDDSWFEKKKMMMMMMMMNRPSSSSSFDHLDTCPGRNSESHGCCRGHGSLVMMSKTRITYLEVSWDIYTSCIISCHKSHRILGWCVFCDFFIWILCIDIDKYCIFLHVLNAWHEYAWFMTACCVVKGCDLRVVILHRLCEGWDFIFSILAILHIVQPCKIQVKD